MLTVDHQRSDHIRAIREIRGMVLLKLLYVELVAVAGL